MEFTAPAIPVAGLLQNQEPVHFSVGSDAPEYASLLVERQTEGVIGTLPYLHINFRLSPSLRDKVEKMYGCTILSLPYGQEPTNAIDMVGLAYLEAVAFSRMDTTGGPPLVNAIGPRLLRNPVNIVVRDHTVANGFVSARFPQTVCGCGGGDPIMCDHPCDYAFFGTSIGNVTPQAVLALLLDSRKRVGYAIFPIVADVMGRVSKDLSYYHSDAGVITWNDGSTTFRTLDPHYLEDGHTFFPVGNIDVNRLERIRIRMVHEPVSGFALYELSVYSPGEDFVPDWRYSREETPWSPTADGDGQASQWDALQPNDKYVTYSTTVGQAATHAFKWHEVNVSHITYASAWICFTTPEKHRVLFSRQLAFKGLTIFMHRPRTPELLVSVTRWVNGEYSKVTSVPDEVKYRAASATVIYIMVRIGFESDLLQKHVGAAHLRWGQHKELVALRAPYAVTKEKVVGGVAFTGLTTYVAHCGDVATRTFLHNGVASVTGKTTLVMQHAAAVKMTAAAAGATSTVLSFPVALAVWSAVTVAGMAYHTYRSHTGYEDVVTQFANQSPNENPPQIPAGVYDLPPGLAFGATNVVKRAAPPQEEGSSVIAPTNADVKPPTKKVQASGLCFQITPSYAENNAENQVIALTNRLTLKTPVPVEGLWAQVAAAVVATEIYRLVGTELDAPENRFSLTKMAVANYARRFPKSRAAELLDGFEQFVQQGRKLMARDKIAGMFVKGELHNKPAFDASAALAFEPNEMTPRSIIMFKPIINAVFGPLVAHFYEINKRTRLRFLDGDHVNYKAYGFCPNGVPGEERALWLKLVIDYLGGPDNVVTFENDDVKHDAHHSKDSLNARRDVTIGRVRGREMPDLLRMHVEMDTVTGKSTAGVRFTEENKVCSGSSLTSAGNSATSEMKTSYALSDSISDIVDDVGFNYFIAAEGDDVWGVIRRSWFESRFRDSSPVDTFVYRNKSLGFTAEPKFYVGEVGGTFCSRLWYPVGDHWLPGAKIGRTLAKAGYFFETKDSQSVYSAALGQLQDNHHVPFLREYFEVVVRICRKRRMPLSGKPSEYSIHMREKHDYDDSTLLFVEKVYGLTRLDLEEFKGLLSKVTTLPALISWPKLETCLAKDME